MKRLIGHDLGGYVFNPAARTITLTKCPAFALENLLLITNLTAKAELFNFASDESAATIANNVITLAVDTTAMSAADALQIWAYVPVQNTSSLDILGVEESFVRDTHMERVFGPEPITDQQGVKTSTVYKRRSQIKNLIGLNSEVRIDCEGMNTVAVQLSGTWAGTISFEASVNGADFTLIAGAAIFANAGVTTSGGSVVTSSTANNIFSFNCAGIKYIRCRYSTYTSGICSVAMAADAARPAQTFPTSQTTSDTNFASSVGGTPLYSPSFIEQLQQIIAPSVSPPQPTAYADNKYARYPQKYRRLRVEVGASQGLPLAQEENTNKLLVAMPDLVTKIEELLLQQALTNSLLAQAFNLPLPKGFTEFR